MKRSDAVVSKQTELARQRAVVRNLIEQNGWAPAREPVPLRPMDVSSSLNSNIIPFPSADQRARFW